MAKFRYKHIQSTVEDKVPSNLLDGEIAVNRFKGKEKLFLKNASGDVVSFSTDSQIDGKLTNKLNVSDFNTYSGTVNTAISSKASESDLNTLSGTVTGHTTDTAMHFTTTEKINLDSLVTNIAAISGITSTKVSNWDSAATNSHTHSNRIYIDGITGTVGTMAYESANSYSSATQVNTALGYKADKADAVVSAVTVSSDLSNVTCPNSITGASKSGAQAIVIYENGGTTTDYTITVSTNYKSPDGSQISITCAKGGYCEVSYINVNGTIYARGA